MCLCFIVQPDILHRIATNGSPEARDAALKSLALSERMRGRREVLASVMHDAPSLAGGLKRTVFDAKNAENLPGAIVREEGAGATKDICADEAYDGAGTVYSALQALYHRNSIDDRGLRLDSTVHYGSKYDNAFWDGRQMVYGDGDGQIFNRFTAAIDVIGHEHFHGVTQSTAGLVYWDQPGALNESISDVFGTIIKQWTKKQKFKDADWLIGAELLKPGIKGTALRSLKAPGTAYNDPVLGRDEQPNHMKNYLRTNQDNGGVHLNSGIANHAFYLVAEQLQDTFVAGTIWYKCLTERLRPRSDFAAAATLFYRTAAELHGTRSKEANAVVKAWGAVGVAISR